MLRLIAENKVMLLNNETAKTMAGVSIGLVSSYVPFAAAFSLARAAHLNTGVVAGFEGLIAGAGLAACIMGAIAIYDSRQCLKTVAVIGMLMMALLGVLVSLTV